MSDEDGTMSEIERANAAYVPCEECEGDGCHGPNPTEDGCKRCGGSGCEPTDDSQGGLGLFFSARGDLNQTVAKLREAFIRLNAATIEDEATFARLRKERDEIQAQVDRLAQALRVLRDTAPDLWAKIAREALEEADIVDPEPSGAAS